MLWSDNNYYLLAYESGEMKHFRVDKMDHIGIVPQKRTGKDVFSKMDTSKRPLRMFNMFSGKEKTVKMRFANYLANVVLDRFGRDAVLAYEDEKHFTFTTVIETSPQFYGWLCGLGKGVRVMSPPEVVEEMGNYVKGIARCTNRYKERGSCTNFLSLVLSCKKMYQLVRTHSPKAIAYFSVADRICFKSVLT